MGLTTSKEPDTERARHIAEEGCILWVYRTQPEGSPSGPGDLDLTIYGLRKFCRLAMKGSPTVLLLLFIDDSHVMVRTLGTELQALAPGSREPGRNPDARAFSTARLRHTKYAMHSLRIAYQGIELLTTGRISLPVHEKARRHLMAVRRGELPLPEVIAGIQAKRDELEEAVLGADIPEAAECSAIDEFLVRAYRQAWAARS